MKKTSRKTKFYVDNDFDAFPKNRIVGLSLL